MIDLAIDSRMFINSEFDEALQEIDMLLNTTSTELLGDPYYGVTLETFLWTLTPTTTELENYISEKLRDTMFASKFGVTVKAQYYKGPYRSVYLVNITLKNGSGDTVTRKYQYQ